MESECIYPDKGSRIFTGYVRVNTPDGPIGAHRLALEAKIGRKLTKDEQAGHLCHDSAAQAGECAGGPCAHRACINPDHLAVQTRSENISASPNAATGRTTKKAPRISLEEMAHLRPDGFITYADISDLSGVTIEALQVRLHRGHIPDPDMRLRQPLWKIDTIRPWLEKELKK